MRKFFTLLNFVVLCNILVSAQSGWTTLTSGTSDYFHSVNFTNTSTGYAVGGNSYYGTILKTTNGGLNRTLQTSGTTSDLTSIFFIDANTGFTVGYHGTILKTSTRGEQSIFNFNTSNFNNLNIYPNPNDGKFILGFANSNKKLVTISIFDLSGKPVLESNSINEKYEFNSTDLQTGIYIVKVIGEKNYYRKLVVK